MPESQKKVPLPDLKGQILVQFADITSDMFTDIITVDKTGKNIIIHIFDAMSSNYSQKISFQPEGCAAITSVAVGRGPNTLRLFVSCTTSAGKNIIKLYDRNMNDELLEDVSQNKKILENEGNQGKNTGESTNEQDLIENMKE